jgi:hypothetical protein
MVVMEIVFLNNLLEAAKDLKEDEILFCPMGHWAESYIKEIGGIVVNDEKLKRFTDDDFDFRIESFRVFGYHDFRYHGTDDRFLCVFKPGLVVGSWEDLFGKIRKNGKYLKNEILRNVEPVKVLKDYSLFVYKNIESSEEKGFIKSMLFGEASEKLVEAEKERVKYYLKAIKKIIGKTLRELKLVVSIPSHVIEKGVRGITKYIKEGGNYVESIAEGSKILMVFSTGVERGTEVKTRLAVNYEKDRVYITFGKVYDEYTGKTYLLGVPIFKGKISQASSIFRLHIPDSTTKDDLALVIGKRKEPKAGKGRVSANLIANSFDVRVLFVKNPGGTFFMKGKRKIRRITVLDSNVKVLQLKALERKESEETRQDGYKICNIDIREDGSFLVETDYDNVIDVLITPIKGDGREAQELKELIDKRSIEIKGRITEEVSYSKEGRREIVLEEESESLDEVDKYMVSSLYEFVKKMIRHKVEDNFPLKLSKEKEEDKRLIETIQTGFIQYNIDRILKYFKKIVDLCFESEGRRYFIKTHRIDDPEKIAQKESLHVTGIDKEVLKGEEKSIFEVLKLISYSYPLMDHLSIERTLEELKGLTDSVFSTEKVPLDEIRVFIDRVNPEYLSLPDGYVVLVPSSSALFLIEGDEIKVYTKGYRYENTPYRNVKLLKIGLGDIQISIYS